MKITRRQYLKQSAAVAAAAVATPLTTFADSDKTDSPNMKLGLVTYKWGEKWGSSRFYERMVAKCGDAGLIRGFG